jgi:hypothetical protein
VQQNRLKAIDFLHGSRRYRVIRNGRFVVAFEAVGDGPAARRLEDLKSFPRVMESKGEFKMPEVNLTHSGDQ